MSNDNDVQLHIKKINQATNDLSGKINEFNRLMERLSGKISEVSNTVSGATRSAQFISETRRLENIAYNISSLAQDFSTIQRSLSQWSDSISGKEKSIRNQL